MESWLLMGGPYRRRIFGERESDIRGGNLTIAAPPLLQPPPNAKTRDQSLQTLHKIHSSKPWTTRHYLKILSILPALLHGRHHLSTTELLSLNLKAAKYHHLHCRQLTRHILGNTLANKAAWIEATDL